MPLELIQTLPQASHLDETERYFDLTSSLVAVDSLTIHGQFL